jgi:hypothetical protein
MGNFEQSAAINKDFEDRRATRRRQLAALTAAEAVVAQQADDERRASLRALRAEVRDLSAQLVAIEGEALQRFDRAQQLEARLVAAGWALERPEDDPGTLRIDPEYHGVIDGRRIAWWCERAQHAGHRVIPPAPAPGFTPAQRDALASTKRNTVGPQHAVLTRTVPRGAQ